MALSYYSDWVGASQPLLSSYTNADSFPPVELPQQEFHQFAPTSDAWNIDPVLHADDLFYTGNSSSLQYDYLSGMSLYDSFNYLSAEDFLLQQNFEPFQYPKRQKGCDYEEIYPEFTRGYFNGIVPNPPTYSNYEISLPSLPDFPTGPPGYSYGSCESSTTKELAPSGSLSAQSIAARQRRRKITEKTQDLGKLVPGGQKMNTAEMLQAAYKYITYLQAQVGILEFMSNKEQEQEEQFESDGKLHDLLESPLMQEKLYSTGKCLVPQKIVQELSNDHQIMQSNPALLQLQVKQDQSRRLQHVE